MSDLPSDRARHGGLRALTEREHLRSECAPPRWLVSPGEGFTNHAFYLIGGLDYRP